MDFGTYERFIKKDMTGDLSLTGGKLFSKLIEKERKGGYLGKDVQIIPHLTDEIINYVKGIAKGKKLDVLVIEVGGHRWGYRKQLFYRSDEAAFSSGKSNICSIDLRAPNLIVAPLYL